jgi:predicted cupin superfamily sugar epimerase
MNFRSARLKAVADMRQSISGIMARNNDIAERKRKMTIDLRDPSLTASAVAEALGLSPHPEGGRYREIWRDRPTEGGRGAGTSITFLLGREEFSHWHRIDAAEIWLWQAGAPLLLEIDDRTVRLGPDLAGGETLQAVVPAGAWQAARPRGAWSLVACVVAPAFEFEGFEMAPAGWKPPARR